MDMLAFLPSKMEPTRYNEEHFARALLDAPLPRSRDTAIQDLIANILVAAASPTVRNAAAIALVDLGARDRTDALLEVIARAELAQHNGTLIFALSQLGGVLPAGLLVQIIAQGSYEATAEALRMLDDGRVSAPTDQVALDALRESVAALRGSGDDAISEPASLLLEQLSV